MILEIFEMVYIGAVVVLVAAAAVAVIWQSGRGLQMAVALSYTSALIALTLATASALSYPRPVTLEWWYMQVETVEEAVVAGAVVEPEEAIHLWLQLGEVRPRAFTIPWDQEVAEQLQEAMRRAEREGGEVVMRYPFYEGTLDKEEPPRFYLPPQPALPPKHLFNPPSEVEEFEA